jgi:CheY-like chemotaxis protein
LKHLAPIARILPSLNDDGRSPFTGLRVLVLEDHDDSREMLRAMLELYDMTVYAAASAEEGYTLFRQHRPNLIIADIGMPGEDGYQAIRRIRQELGGASVPAIALTGFSSDKDRTRAVVSGFHVHLPKPLERERLLAAIRSLLGVR